MIGLGIGLFSNVAALSGGAAPALSPYLGQVATRSAIHDSSLAQTKILSRTVHYSTEALTSIKVKFPAWYTNGASDIVVGSDVTYTASIEYPAGTFTQVKWSASASVVATNGSDTGLSDAITVSIPANTQFWVRNYATTTVAGLPTSIDAFWASNDAAVIDGTATDLTMSGTVTNTSAGKAVYPLCIVQTTTRPTFLLVGDSRTATAGVDSFGNHGQAAPSLTNAYGYINTGKSAALIRDFDDGGGTARAALQQYCSHVIHGFGINDIGVINSRTAAQVQADFLAAAYAFPGKSNIICTLSPYTTSTDSWATLGNQTVNANDAQRIAFNTWARAVPDPFSACCDIASITESGGAGSPSGKWVVGYTTDGIHQNNTGAAAIVSGGVIAPATLGASAGISRFSTAEFSPFEWFDANDAAAAGSTPVKAPWGGGRFAAIGTATYGATSFNSGPGYTITSGSALNVPSSPVSKNAATIFVGILATWPTTPGSIRGIGGYTINSGSSVARAMILVDTAGKPGIGITRLDADTPVQAFGSSALTAGTPYLLVAQFDPTNGTAKLYVNGVLTATANYASTGSTSNTTSAFSITNWLSSGGTGLVLGEYIGFNAPSATSAANDTIRQKLEGDMAWRRAAAATFLPGGHPYLSVRPPV